MAKRWIVVAVGKRPGIYDDWIEAQPHVHGIPGALFKGYPTLEEAEQAFEKACRAGTVKTVRMESAEDRNEFRRPNPAEARDDSRQPPAPETGARPRQPDPGQAFPARSSAPKGKGKQQPEEKYQPNSRHRTRDGGTSGQHLSSAGRPREPQASSSRVDGRQTAHKEDSELDHIFKMMKVEDPAPDTSAHCDTSQHRCAAQRKSSYLSSPPTGVSQHLPSDRSSMSERGSPIRVSRRSSNSKQSPIEDARDVGTSSARVPQTPPAWRGQQNFTPQKRSSDIESLYMSDPPSRRPSRKAQSISSWATGPSGQIGLATSSSSSRKITRTESMPAATSSSPATEVTQYGSASLPPSPVRRICRTVTRDANTQTNASPVRHTQPVQAPSIKESLDDEEDAWMAAHGDIGADDPPVFEFASPSSSASHSPCRCSSRKACPTCGRPVEATAPNTPRTRPATPVLSNLSPELSIRTVASCVSPTEAASTRVPATPVDGASTPSRVPLPASPRSPMANPSGRTRTPGTPLYPSLAGVSEMLGLTGLSQPLHAANLVHDAGLDPRSPFAGSTRAPMFAGRSHAFGRPTPSIMPGTLSLGGEM